MAEQSTVSAGNLGGLLSDFLSGPGGSLLQTGLGVDALNELKGIGNTAQTEGLAIGKQAQTDTAFKPFSISTGFGNIQTDPTGGYSTTLSPQGQAQQQQLQGITNSLMGGMGGFGGMEPAIGTDMGMRQYLNNRGGMEGGGMGMNVGGINRPGFDYAGNPLPGSSPAPQLQKPQPMPMMQTMEGGAPNLSGIQGQAFGGIQGLLQQAQGGTAGREQNIYDRIRATQMPEEQRNQIALNEQLAAQGRTGLRTAQFGGSPEQFAMEKARAESMNQASLMSINQAEQQRTNDLAQATGMFGLGTQAAGLGTGLQQGQLGNIQASMGLQYMPEQQLLGSLTPGISLADIAGTGQRTGAGLFAEAGAAGLEANLGAQQNRAEGLAGLYNALINSQGQAASAGIGAAGTTQNTAQQAAIDLARQMMGVG